MTARRLLRWGGLLLSLPVLALFGLNVFINVWLEFLINQQPQRVRIRYDFAWMLVPGEVRVRNLQIRVQGPMDQWVLQVDDASGTILLDELPERIFHATNLRGSGATYIYRGRADARRLDATGAVIEPPPPSIDAARTKPIIPGLSNPPLPTPEALYGPPRTPFRIVLDDVVVEDVREAWLEDYHFVGGARAAGNLSLKPTEYLEVRDAVVDLEYGEVRLGDAPVVNRIHGRIGLSIDRVNPLEHPGTTLFGFMTARAKLDAEVPDVGFLNFYLAEAQWLSLRGGAGTLEVDATLRQGRFLEGSRARLKAADLVAELLSYRVTGNAVVELDVGTRDAKPESTVKLYFLDYALAQEGDATPHVRGSGLRVTARSPDVELDRPFTKVDVRLEIPDAEIPDLGVYNAYLPRELGLVLREGTGRIHGQLEATSADSRVHGEMSLTASGVAATLDDLRITGDLALRARLVEGDLTNGRYDVSGSLLELKNVGVAHSGKDDDAAPDRHASNGWWATIALPTGKVHVGAPIFLHANLGVRFRDVVPFVTLFAERQPLAGWVRDLLAIKDVSGSARVQLGDDTLYIPRFAVRGGDRYELLLALRRKQQIYTGNLYARYGVLSVGMELLGRKNKVHPFGARRWFDAQPPV